MQNGREEKAPAGMSGRQPWLLLMVWAIPGRKKPLRERPAANPGNRVSGQRNLENASNYI